jgi:hypothetical protein
MKPPYPEVNPLTLMSATLAPQRARLLSSRRVHSNPPFEEEVTEVAFQHRIAQNSSAAEIVLLNQMTQQRTGYCANFISRKRK